MDSTTVAVLLCTGGISNTATLIESTSSSSIMAVLQCSSNNVVPVVTVPGTTAVEYVWFVDPMVRGWSCRVLRGIGRLQNV